MECINEWGDLRVRDRDEEEDHNHHQMEISRPRSSHLKSLIFKKNSKTAPLISPHTTIDATAMTTINTTATTTIDTIVLVGLNRWWCSPPRPLPQPSSHFLYPNPSDQMWHQLRWANKSRFGFFRLVLGKVVLDMSIVVGMNWT